VLKNVSVKRCKNSEVFLTKISLTHPRPSEVSKMRKKQLFSPLPNKDSKVEKNVQVF